MYCMKYDIMLISNSAVTRLKLRLASLRVLRLDEVGKSKVKFDLTSVIHVSFKCYSMGKI